MPELPSGTVTFLFTDIEGSTRLLHDLGPERYAEALAGHRRVLREAFARHGGFEVDTQGDAFFAAFPTVTGALEAAREGAASLSRGPVRVRMGVHTGSPLRTEEGYVGDDVHRAARIAAAGHGGQVLVSASTHALSDGSNPFRDLGEHRLKDLAAPERLWQLGDHDFPPLKSLYRTNLPVPQTAFLGRSDEVRAVADLVVRADTRLVTLTGPGGTGKTRLALQAAAEAADAFPDGVTWIALAPLRDPGFVLPAVAGALGLADEGGQPAEAVATALAGTRTLLLLDNAEHLVPQVADELAPLLEVEGPTLLLTSRERLQLQAEHVVDVPPLPEPEGVELFLTRARAAGAAVAPSQAVAELCGRLDHLPLALELAAARTPLFSPEQLLERVGQRLDLLRGGRGVDARQQTLRATIEWSHDLLSDEERRLFRRLAVFVGGCTYEAAEEICDADPDGLQSLLAKSLVRRRDGSTTGPRYWMLETIREFATERLAAADDAAEVAARHARWYADLGAVHQRARRDYEESAVAIFDAELSNLRAAVASALTAREPAVSGHLLFALFFPWLSQGHGGEALRAARAWLELDRSGLEPLERVPGLLAAGEIVRFTGDQTEASELKQELIEICRAHGEASVYGWPLRRTLAALLSDLSTIELQRGRLDDAATHAGEALELRRELGDPNGVAHALEAVAQVAVARREFAGARDLFREAETGWRTAGRPLEAAQTQLEVAECTLFLDDATEAARLLGGAIDAVAAGHDVMWTTYAVHVAAMIAASCGDAATAAELRGAVAATEERSGQRVLDGITAELGAEFVRTAVEALGVADYDRRFAAGRGMDEQAMVERAKSVAKRCAHG